MPRAKIPNSMMLATMAMRRATTSWVLSSSGVAELIARVHENHTSGPSNGTASDKALTQSNGSVRRRADMEES